MTITYSWRGEFEKGEVNALHAEGFDHRLVDDDIHAILHRHSLGWVIARDADELVGFVNVAWDGLVHAFILDTLVAERARHHGIGTQLIVEATDGARSAGCEWLHVDFDHDLEGFYVEACGFRPTRAGLIKLR
ncbi:MAG TPA: GNAT family N-acetyltransferase [Microbacteriaceae bacterium]|nr:GNAT family N-acetyltransferase [Microbacteriaceae bacterium]